MMPDPARTDGVRRWDDWLTGELSPHEVLRESSWTPRRSGITWRIRFPGGLLARIHVAPEALALDPEAFRAATTRILARGLLYDLQTTEAGVLLVQDGHRMEVLD